MANINILSSDTINKIAAGEVIERPVNVVKELVENAIDAGSTAITIEIKGGGIDMIRVTDNGSGIEASQITKAFRRHATSKIADADDLSALMTLGFRGEALSSIAAVSQVEMITKTRDSLTGTRAVNTVDVAAPSLQSSSSLNSSSYRQDALVAPGGAAAENQGRDALAVQAGNPAAFDRDAAQLSLQEVGAPDGTTVIVRNIFYNVPVRRKFLKTPQTEGGYITDLVEHLALSHPDISFHYRMNGQEKLHTTGNGDEKELIYRIYGRTMAQTVIPIHTDGSGMTLEGYLGRPEFSRSARSFETFFVNGRILRSDVLSKALEEGYRTDLMQHRFPFAVLHLTLLPEEVDVNVHPSKMEVRFSNPKAVFDFINEGVHAALHKVELIPKAGMDTEKEENERARAEEKARELAAKRAPHTEQFEQPDAPSRPLDTEGLRMETASPENGENSGKAAAENDAAGAAGIPGSTAKADAEQSDSAGSAEDDEFVFEDRRPAAQTVLAQTSVTYGDTASGTESVTAGEADETLSAAGAPADSLWAQGTPADRKGHYEQASLFEEEKDLPPVTEADSESGGEPIGDEPGSAHGTKNNPQIEDRAVVSSNIPDENDLHYHMLSRENIPDWHIVGQVFDTYWIVEFRDKMLMIDQHAAHEKVNFERLMRRLEKEQNSPAASQMLAPPIVVNLTGKEEAAYLQYQETFRKMGYEIEPFGESSYAMRAVPLELYANEPDSLFREVLDEILQERMSGTPYAILYKIASMSCKAAVKGNMHLTFEEARALIGELLSLDNPYHCPHGRPTMIVMPKSEIEKKFKRIV